MKRLLILLIVLLSLGLSGCGTTVSNKTLEIGMEKCETNKGLSHIWVEGDSKDITFICNNGAEFVYEYKNWNSGVIVHRLTIPAGANK